MNLLFDDVYCYFIFQGILKEPWRRFNNFNEWSDEGVSCCFLRFTTVVPTVTFVKRMTRYTFDIRKRTRKFQ